MDNSFANRFLPGSNDQADRFSIDTKRAVEGDILALEYGNVRVDGFRTEFDGFWFAGDRRCLQFQAGTVLKKLYHPEVCFQREYPKAKNSDAVFQKFVMHSYLYKRVVPFQQLCWSMHCRCV